MNNFCKNNQKYFSKKFKTQNIRNTISIYVSSDFKSAQNLEKNLKSQNCSNFLIFSTIKLTNSAEIFFLPFSALQAANFYRSQDFDVLLIFDNVLDLF